MKSIEPTEDEVNNNLDNKSNINFTSSLSGGQKVRCNECKQIITDRYYLRTHDEDKILGLAMAWHCYCLKCHHCDQLLDSSDEQLTCFSLGGMIYCPNDYYKLFCPKSYSQFKKCTKCLNPITPKQMVIKITDATSTPISTLTLNSTTIPNDNNDNCDSKMTIYYHVDCFICQICNEKLRKGDYFGMHLTEIYCQYHFELLNNKMNRNYYSSSKSKKIGQKKKRKSKKGKRKK